MKESLAKLQVAREAIAAFVAEFGDKDSFVAEQRKAQQEFETQVRLSVLMSMCMMRATDILIHPVLGARLQGGTGAQDGKD